MTRRSSTLFLLLLSLCFSLSVRAATAPLFTEEFFKKQVMAGLAESDDEILIRNLTDLYGKFGARNYPNCFECALWIARAAPETSPSKELILAEYATRFAPDLPEAHLHRFAMALEHRPGDLGLASASLSRAATTMLADPRRDAFIGSLCRVVGLFAAGLFLALMITMLFKYGRALWHLYSHVGAFSLFHKAIGLVVAAAAVVLAFKQVIGLEVFFLLWLFFCYRTMRYRELSILIVLLTLYLAADIWRSSLVRTAPDMTPERWEVYRAVYDPPFAGKLTVSGHPELSFAHGMQAIFAGEWGRAEKLLATYAEGLRDPARQAIVDNLRGIVAAERRDHEAARKFFSDAVKQDERPSYLYNLSRALYAEGNIKDAEQVEMRSVALSGRAQFTYPEIVLPPPYTLARAIAGIRPVVDPAHDPLFLRISALLILMLAVGLMWRLAGGRTTVSCCVECGGIICEECGGGDEEVCLTCRVVKAGRNLVASDEQRLHATRRERWSNQRRVVSIALSFLLPGMGSVYNDDILEGFFLGAAFWSLVLLFIAPGLFGYFALTVSLPMILPLIGGLLLLILWLMGLMRSWQTSLSG